MCYLFVGRSPVTQSRRRLENGSRWFEPSAWPIFLMIVIAKGFIHCSCINSILTSIYRIRLLNDGHVGKQPVAWKEYCAEYRLNELQEDLDRCTGYPDITEIMLKAAYTIQSILGYGLKSLN